MHSTQSGPVALAAVAAVAVLAGCSSQSAKDKWISSIDQRCDALTRQFTGKLAWGDSIGVADLSKMDKRVALIRDLRKHAREDAPPDVNRRNLDDWLNKLGAYAQDTQKMRNVIPNAPPGAAIFVATLTDVVKGDAEGTKAPAQRLGLRKCTQVDGWEKLG